MNAFDRKLARLATLSPPELRTEWPRVTKKPLPNMGPTLLALGIAFSIQEKFLGGLPIAQGRELEKLSERYAQTGETGTGDAITLKTGSRLVREWRGETHDVLVAGGGYQYRKRRYRSLSQIARVITGTHWSGPRFFNLKPADQSHEEALGQ